ncbi:hypothetical protein HS041_36720 [Planomonospora sp. ID67723]|uniref:hypothetical protein n=1 Tax=Planomonospora sp. ID67723 TaxID=2738134 RepID=UPI0018C3E035|nr:hypothetical protein [Planomonospora sp. ID67723]MBG0833248.1 hypothetical protein [Planomonospora sp. ID67723]
MSSKFILDTSLITAYAQGHDQAVGMVHAIKRRIPGGLLLPVTSVIAARAGLSIDQREYLDAELLARSPKPGPDEIVIQLGVGYDPVKVDLDGDAQRGVSGTWADLGVDTVPIDVAETAYWGNRTDRTVLTLAGKYIWGPLLADLPGVSFEDLQDGPPENWS